MSAGKLSWRVWSVRLAVGLALAAGLLALAAYLALAASLPLLEGEYALRGLGGEARVEFDRLGIPAITAPNRADAFRLLGFVSARDRLFQMDLFRRSAAGELAEVVGAAGLESDRWHRVLGFAGVAAAALAGLPQDQREALAAYAEGVNEAIAQFRVLPFEFLLLGYAPKPWRAEDSLLVILDMCVALDWGMDKENKERAATVMEKVLPAELYGFLTPKTDAYTERLLAGAEKPAPLPLAELAKRLGVGPAPAAGRSYGYEPPTLHGSNGWAVGGARTRDGRAILANDMHLDVGVPNIWYRAELHYPGAELAGLTLPGVPLLVSGSNGKLAWGFTGSGVDVADLVLVEEDPANPAQYRTAQGPRRFEEREEILHVRGRADERLKVRGTQWGPVLAAPLLGRPVALRWAALEPAATNLELLNLDRAASVAEAVGLLHRAGGPVLNALLADAGGNIGWTLTGKIPKRRGGVGIAARSWADGCCAWEGFLQDAEIPRIINPPSGLLVNANQRMAEGLGYDYAPGYRAWRIDERLRGLGGVDEADMLGVQLDTWAGFYRYYRDLALDALASRGAGLTAAQTALRRHLQSWDGRAEPDSLGLALLVEFRRDLLDSVFTPLLADCREAEPRFDYRWSFLDAALRRLLDARRPELLPQGPGGDWNGFLLARLEHGADQLGRRLGLSSLDQASWARASARRIAHPLSDAVPGLAWLLDMPQADLPGCPQCVRVADRVGGATERLVVSPGHEAEAILHMPGGQSGHPLSPHYRDQQGAWLHGLALPLRAEGRSGRLLFHPQVEVLSHAGS